METLLLIARYVDNERRGRGKILSLSDIGKLKDISTSMDAGLGPSINKHPANSIITVADRQREPGSNSLMLSTTPTTILVTPSSGSLSKQDRIVEWFANMIVKYCSKERDLVKQYSWILAIATIYVLVGGALFNDYSYLTFASTCTYTGTPFAYVFVLVGLTIIAVGIVIWLLNQLKVDDIYNMSLASRLKFTLGGIAFVAYMIVTYVFAKSSPHVRYYFPFGLISLLPFLCSHFLSVLVPIGQYKGCDLLVAPMECFRKRILSLGCSPRSSSLTTKKSTSKALRIEPTLKGLRMVLDTEELWVELKNFMVKEFAVENILFERKARIFITRRNRCLEAMGYSQFTEKTAKTPEGNITEYSTIPLPKELYFEAKMIYEEFIHPNGINSVNIPHTCRETIKKLAVPDENGSNGVFCNAFEKVYEHIVQLILSGSFRAFLTYVQKEESVNANHKLLLIKTKVLEEAEEV